MNRFNGLDNLMGSFGLSNTKVFEAYWKEILAPRENQNLNIDGFVWDAPQIDFKYEQLEAENKIETMAHYVALGSDPKVSGNRVKMDKLVGSVPRQKYRVERSESDYRDQLIALENVISVARFNNTGETRAIKEYLSKHLFETLDTFPSVHKNSINYQIGQAKMRGALELTDKNNPNGTIFTTFDFGVPAENRFDKEWYNKKTDGSIECIGDPIKDLRDFVRELRRKVNGYQNVVVELSERFMYKLLDHTAVLTAIGYYATGLGLRYTKENSANALAVAMNMGYEAQKAAFVKLIEANDLKVHNTIVGVEKFNSATKNFDIEQIDAYNDDVILVRPAGNIGVIKNVVPLRPDGSAVCAGLFGNRGIVEYFYDAKTRTQTWQSELTALAILTRPRDMYYFNAKTKQAGAQVNPQSNHESDTM